MLRNEADIVEAFVRHNLSILDGLVVIDHGSFDETTDILSRMHREGLRLRIVRDIVPAFFQAERLTAITRETFSGGECRLRISSRRG
jgi:hypothetical protein